jgi:hypothetical protein
MPSLVSMYPRYSISSGQNFDFAALTFSTVSRSCLSTSYSFSRWSSRLNIEMQRRLSRYALTNSKDSISSSIFPWKMSGEPAIPIGSLL